MTFSTEGRTGSLTNYRISGAASQIENLPHTGYRVAVDGNDIIGQCSKRDIPKLRTWAESLNVAPIGRKSSNGRYIELLMVAERDGLNYGQSWIADGYAIDKYSIHPSFQGERICYVYPH